MDLYAILEGPVLWVVFLIFFTGVFFRSLFFIWTLAKGGRRHPEEKHLASPIILARFFLPLHKAFAKKPLYSASRYIFHVCLFIVPIWLSGHIVLWSESRFEWEWAALPDAWADWMTLLFLALAAYFLLRRFISKRIRRDSSIADILLILIAALPFLTGYLLTHDTLDAVAFLGDNMVIIHMLSGQLMILTVLFLFYKPCLDVESCTGCASCVQNCPTRTLEAQDHGNLRIFNYAHFQCICCGACVGVCPEGAAHLRHEINARRLVQAFSKRPIRSVELEACERCGAYFAPEPQMEKIGSAFAYDCIKCCPDCRKTKMGERLHQMSPWHRSLKESEAALKTVHR